MLTVEKLLEARQLIQILQEKQDRSILNCAMKYPIDIKQNIQI